MNCVEHDYMTINWWTYVRVYSYRSIKYNLIDISFMSEPAKFIQGYFSVFTNWIDHNTSRIMELHTN